MSNRFCPVVLLMCVAVSAGAQRYDRLLKRNLWNDASNIAAVRLDSLSFSEVSLAGEYEAGDFRNISQPASQYSVSALARAVRHLDIFSMTGGFGFENVEAADMCGSMFVEPGFFPVDVMEFTPGRKSFQHYLLSGGVSVPLSEKWIVGAGLDFRAVNASKRKDLRYTGYKLDLGFSPSVVYDPGNYAFGLSFVFGRNTETVSAEQIGSAQNAPFAFFDEGLCFGNYQVWTGSGTRLNEDGVKGLPVSANSLGGALQFAAGGFLAELRSVYGKGKAGERQNVWYRFEGPESSMKLAYRYGKHTFRAFLSYSSLANRESVLDKVTEGGLSLVREYGSNKVLEYGILESGMGYDLTGDILELELRAGLGERREIASPMYPFVFGRRLLQYDVSAHALFKPGAYELGLDAAFSDGMAEDSAWTVAEPAAGLAAPERMNGIYASLTEYATVPKIAAGISAARYFGKIYVAAGASALKAFGVETAAGSWRWNASLEIGLTF